MPDNYETKRDWETVQENVGKDKTERLKIHTGWLYRVSNPTSGAVAVTFVPDTDDDA
jgi:hypothetical protein